jgi:hypothetical protein
VEKTMTTKMTKKERLETLVAILEGDVVLDDIADVEGYVDFCNKEIAALDKKAAKAKETAAKKKAESDALTDKLADALTDEFASIPDIIKTLGDEDVTPQKAAIRLSKLAEAGRAVKGEISLPTAEGKARKVVAYKA